MLTDLLGAASIVTSRRRASLLVVGGLGASCMLDIGDERESSLGERCTATAPSTANDSLPNFSVPSPLRCAPEGDAGLDGCWNCCAVVETFSNNALR